MGPVRRPSAARRWALVPAAMVCLLVLACSEEPQASLRVAGHTMGTTYTVQVSRPPAGLDAEVLQREIDAILAAVNTSMSTYDPDSELSRLNRNPSTDWVAVSPQLLDVLQAAQAVSELTAGVFDVTVGPLVNLWGFGPGATAGGVPAEAALAAARARVGYTLLALREDAPAVRKERGDLYVDLSAIAKGHAVDRVAAHLESLGLEEYLVEIGGELRALGRNPRKEPWAIAVERPSPGQRSVERVLRLESGGVASSGDYRNFFEHEGQRYSHAIDPRTARPIRHRLASVTVVAESCMYADAMATALLVMGPEAGYRLAETEGVAALFILIGEGGTFLERGTPAIQRYLTS